MKIRPASIVQAITLSILLSLPIAFSPGCATTPTAQAKVYNTFLTSWTVSKAAYDAWVEGVVNGEVSKDKEAKVDAAWNKYRLVFKATFNLSVGNWQAPTPETLAAAEAELISLIRSLSK